MSIHSCGLGHDNDLPQAEPSDEFLPLYCSLDEWQRLTGMSRRTIYENLGAGNLRAKKFGAATRIDVRHAVRFLRSLPDATIKPSKRTHEAA